MFACRSSRGVTVVSIVAALVLLGFRAEALKVGDKVKTVKVKDANDNPAWIPDIGRKIVTLFYTDPDEKDMNEPFRNRLKAAKLDKRYYRGMGVANLKDTWKPNWIIRSIIRRKIKKFKSLILTDTDHTLKRRWRLGNCNDKDVVIVIGKDRRVKYIKKYKMSSAAQAKTLKLVKRLIAAAKAKKAAKKAAPKPAPKPKAPPAKK